MKTKSRKLATLTKAEDAAWVYAFEYYKGIGLTDKRADERAWTDTKFEHPRLRGFDGCRAKVGAK